MQTKNPLISTREAVSAMSPGRSGLELAPFGLRSGIYGREDLSWKMIGKKFPYSCTDEEGAIIFNIISAHGLQRGFEIATAFGYSSCYIGLGFKETGGKLTSIDCYIEEGKEDYIYSEQEMRSHTDEVKQKIDQGWLPTGLQVAINNSGNLKLDGMVEYKVGLSPQNVPALLNHEKLDFAFIDGGHFDDQPTKDCEAVLGCLQPTFAILFHDNNDNEAVHRAIQHAAKATGGRIVEFNTRYNLTLVGQGLDWDMVEQVRRRVFRNLPWPVRVSRMIRFAIKTKFGI